LNTSSKEINSLRNALVGGISKIVTLALSFAAKTMFIRYLGAAYLGINGLFTNLFVLMSSVDFGVGVAMCYSLYDPLAQNDEDRISTIYDFYRRLYRIIFVVDLIIGVSLFPFLDVLFNEQSQMANIEIYYILFLANTVLYNLLNYKSYIINADQKRYLTNFYTMIFEGASYIAQIAILILTQNYILYLVITIVKTLGYSLYMAYLARKMYPCIRKCTGVLSAAEKKYLYKNSADMFLYKLSEMMISGTDNIIISLLVGTISVGYYSNYEFIIQGVTSITALGFASLAASVGHMLVENNKEKNIKIFYMLQDLNCWLGGFTTVSILILVQDFVAIWAGREYVLSWPVVISIVVNYYFCVQRDLVKMFRESAGLFHRMMYMGIINAVLNVVLSVVFGTYMGMSGIFLATVVSGLLTSFWYEPYLLHKEYLHCSIKGYLAKQVKCIVLFLICFGVTFLTAGFVRNDNVLSFIVKAVICLFIPNVFYFLVLRKTEAVGALLAAMKAVVRNEKN